MYKDDPQRFALSERLLLLRLRTGLSQTQAAERLAVHRIVLGRWEAAKSEPSIFQALALAELYGVNLNVLVGLEPMPPAGPRPRREDVDEVTRAVKAGEQLEEKHLSTLEGIGRELGRMVEGLPRRSAERRRFVAIQEQLHGNITEHNELVSKKREIDGEIRELEEEVRVADEAIRVLDERQQDRDERLRAADEKVREADEQVRALEEQVRVAEGKLRAAEERQRNRRDKDAP